MTREEGGEGWHLERHREYLRLLASAADARFIAHARTDLPLLLAEVRRLRALLARHGIFAEETV